MKKFKIIVSTMVVFISMVSVSNAGTYGNGFGYGIGWVTEAMDPGNGGE